MTESFSVDTPLLVAEIKQISLRPQRNLSDPIHLSAGNVQPT